MKQHKNRLLAALVLIALATVEGIRMTLPMPATDHLPTIQAWIYPGNPACSAMGEIADGRTIDVLKPQYYNLEDSGVLTQITATEMCNGYSVANAALIKAHSTQQFVTISGSITGIQVLSSSTVLASNAANILISFLHTTGFTGIEMDIEGSGGWSQGQYTTYKTVITALGNALHSAGFKLMIDGPVIFNQQYQNYYPAWHWEDFNALPVDYLVTMCYDLQDDNGAGTPVAPLATITSCCQWMQARITDHNRIVIGLNSYGYHGQTGNDIVVADTYQQSTKYPGFSTATRDASSGEMMWKDAGISYDYSDTTTITGKVQAVVNAGLTNVSIWHLGGNQWLNSQTITAPMQTPALMTPDPTLTAFNTAYPGFATWYASNFDTQGNYIG